LTAEVARNKVKELE
jgi:hypothetical protein